MPKQANPLALITPATNTGTDMSLANSGEYLRRVKLCAGTTKEVGDGEAKEGDLFLTGVENLGRETQAVAVKARPHALRLVEGGSKVGAESFNMDDPVFKTIRESKDSNPFQQEPSDMYGYDFLLWLPEQKTFATIFLAKTALWKSVPMFTKNVGKHATLGSKEEISKKSKKKYRVPTLVVTGETDYFAPTPDELKAALALFDNPRVSARGESADGPAPTKETKAKAGGRKGR